jgi:hypothetical protein
VMFVEESLERASDAVTAALASMRTIPIESKAVPYTIRCNHINIAYLSHRLDNDVVRVLP